MATLIRHWRAGIAGRLLYLPFSAMLGVSTKHWCSCHSNAWVMCWVQRTGPKSCASQSRASAAMLEQWSGMRWSLPDANRDRRTSLGAGSSSDELSVGAWPVEVTMFTRRGTKWSTNVLRPKRFTTWTEITSWSSWEGRIALQRKTGFKGKKSWKISPTIERLA